MEHHDTYVRAERDGDDLIIGVSGSFGEMCYMVAELIQAISKETGMDTTAVISDIVEVSHVTGIMVKGENHYENN